MSIVDAALFIAVGYVAGRSVGYYFQQKNDTAWERALSGLNGQRIHPGVSSVLRRLTMERKDY